MSGVFVLVREAIQLTFVRGGGEMEWTIGEVIEREREKERGTNSHRRWQLSQWNMTEDKNRSLQQSARRTL